MHTVAQLILERFHADLAGVLDASNTIGLIASDTTGKITLFNRGAAQIYGVAPTEAIGRDFAAVLPFHFMFGLVPMRS